jgi:DNA helicase HerA-like ATPase
VGNFQAFKVEYQRVYALPCFAIVVTPPAGADSALLIELTNNILSLVYQVEAFNRRGLGIIFEEVWLYAPLHNMPSWFQETLLTGRHNRISVVGNSQRPASVSKTLVSQCRHVFIGQYFEYRDAKYFEDTFGRIPELATPPKKFEFWWFRTGQKPELISTR